MSTTNYRTIDLSAWTQVGAGGNGITYENPSEPDHLLKVNNARMNHLETIEQEFRLSQAVAELGFPTPAMYEIVRVGAVVFMILKPGQKAEHIRTKAGYGYYYE